MPYVNKNTLQPRFAQRAAVLLATILTLLLPVSTRAQEPSPTPAAGPPLLNLPTPPGERWTIIQGYNCGTHEGWDRMSFDLANREGRTRGAPVRAAADGKIWYWSDATGTLLIQHNDGYLTMYTHMQSHLDLPRGTPVTRGALVGTVGSVGAPQVEPHLHFTLFRRSGQGAGERKPHPLNFAGGLSFSEDGTCNQYGGETVQAPAESWLLAWSRLLQTGKNLCPTQDGTGRTERLCAR
ncbi:MAG TPA: M23 family metallopeptidase [Herpetosiphonaceae bacterium]|nr:M23 family metallopeptidase [Herpetosiphonaceae bacterium]